MSTQSRKRKHAGEVLLKIKKAKRPSGSSHRTGSSGRSVATAMVVDPRASVLRRGYSRGVGNFRSSEVKTVDTVFSAVNMNTTTAFVNLNVPATGTAFYNRIGNEILMKSLHIIGVVNRNGVSPVTAQFEVLRCVLYYDKQSNGANPTVGDILTSFDNAGSTGTVPQIYAHTNPNNFDRFKIIADWRWLIPWNDSVGLTNGIASNLKTDQQFTINKYIKLRGLLTRFKASTPGIGDISSGALSMVFLGSAPATSAAYCFNGSARLRFLD